MKFLKLWDVSGYSERTMSKRPSCQKWAFRGKLSLRYSPVMLRKCHTNPSNVFGGRPNKKIRRVCMEFSKHNCSTISEIIYPEMLIFWPLGLLDIVLSEYPDTSHNFRNFIFMMSHFNTLLHGSSSSCPGQMRSTAWWLINCLGPMPTKS